MADLHIQNLLTLTMPLRTKHYIDIGQNTSDQRSMPFVLLNCILMVRMLLTRVCNDQGQATGDMAYQLDAVAVMAVLQLR